MKNQGEDNYEVIPMGSGQPEFKPRWPGYSDASQRLKTFHSWPTTCCMKPEELVAAGFFYTGQGDRVECFYCGGSLQSWDPTDKALDEHHRFFPLCEFLLYFQIRRIS